MLFNSISFLVFFPTVTLGYFILPHRLRWILLLAGSCYFYMAFVPKYILILAFEIVVNYFVGIALEKTDGRLKRGILTFGILVNVSVLFLFKYFNFFNENIALLAHWLHWNYGLGSLSLLLPIGLSFHTFQSIGYLIDVGRGRQAAERHFGIFSLFVMFYPQLVAGPIERSGNLLRQFYEKHEIDLDRMASGLKLIIWGLFKKMVIADRLADVVNKVYGEPSSYSGPALITATIFFAVQIYCDFSGYSDIAIGAARVMGFRLMENFRQPYFSQSISEFWRRWHISLSTWFKDYVYIPLGGNRVAQWRRLFNLFVTFTVSGIWHGANWTYVIWGALNGCYLIVSVLTEPMRNAMVKRIGLNKIPFLHQIIRMLITFTLICFSWIFFRASSLSSALDVIGHLTSFSHYRVTSLSKVIPQTELIIDAALLAVLLIVDLIQEKKGTWTVLSRIPLGFRWFFYYAILFAIFVLGVYDVAYKTSFIYFQF
ncbi:MBOAT family protein [Paenibacillus filicis]|uniref:MBOAT family protein n=1 Tax=Paenibacillus gyeongsangnamensis TaxID=3388067 RepID=A0ABT4QJ33_9BACL|nr:MBOAT family O-acyltransferase [Paenibacillus filicis]MCZ8516893.1 MBOAT family protein [Paenibacillus filicis]